MNVDAEGGRKGTNNSKTMQDTKAEREGSVFTWTLSSRVEINGSWGLHCLLFNID